MTLENLEKENLQDTNTVIENGFVSYSSLLNQLQDIARRKDHPLSSSRQSDSHRVLHMNILSNLAKDGLLIFEGNNAFKSELLESDNESETFENIEQKIEGFNTAFQIGNPETSLIKRDNFGRWYLTEVGDMATTLEILGVTEEIVGTYGGLGSYLQYIQRWKTRIQTFEETEGDRLGQVESSKEIIRLLQTDLPFQDLKSYVDYVTNDVMVRIQVSGEEASRETVAAFNRLRFANIPPTFKHEILRKTAIDRLIQYDIDNPNKNSNKVDLLIKKIRHVASQALPEILSIITKENREIFGERWHIYTLGSDPTDISFNTALKQYEPEDLNFEEEEHEHLEDKAVFSAAVHIYSQLAVFADIREEQHQYSPLRTSANNDEQAEAYFLEKRKISTSLVTHENTNREEGFVRNTINTTTKTLTRNNPDGIKVNKDFLEDSEMRIALSFKGTTPYILKINYADIININKDPRAIIRSIYNLLLDYKKHAENLASEDRVIAPHNAILGAWGEHRGTALFNKVLLEEAENIEKTRDVLFCVAFGDPDIRNNSTHASGLNGIHVGPSQVRAIYSHISFDGVAAQTLKKSGESVVKKITQTPKGEEYPSQEDIPIALEEISSNNQAIQDLHQKVLESEKEKSYLHEAVVINLGRISDGNSGLTPQQLFYNHILKHSEGSNSWFKEDGGRIAKLVTILISAAMNSFTNSIAGMVNLSHFKGGRLNLLAFLTSGFEGLEDLFSSDSNLDEDIEKLVILLNTLAKETSSLQTSTGAGLMGTSAVLDNLSSSKPVNEVLAAGFQEASKIIIPNFDSLVESLVVISQIDQSDGSSSTAFGKNSIIAIAYSVEEGIDEDSGDAIFELHLNIEINEKRLREDKTLGGGILDHTISEGLIPLLRDKIEAKVKRYLNMIDLIGEPSDKRMAVEPGISD